MKIKKFNQNLGFSLVELLITLGIGSTLILGAVSYYNKVSNDNARRNQAKTLVNYSKGVFSFVANNQALFYNNKTTMPIVTISQDQLIQSGIINKSEFNDIVDNQTGAKLYPCSVIFYNNNKLQGLIYYRTDNPKMDIANADSNQVAKSTAQLLYSLKTLGASGSIITKDDKSNSYVLKTNNNNWTLTPTQMNQFFVQQGGDLFGDGLSQCKGQYIATPSYVLTINNQLNSIQGELNAESNIKQNTNEILTSNPNNLVDTVNLDSTGLSAKAYDNTNNNKLVFQSSSTCTMNPSILSTMQDYDPNCPGPNCLDQSLPKYRTQCNDINLCSNLNIANKFGCRNKQLTVGLQSANVCNAGQGDCNTSQPKQLNAIMVNGFNQANTGYTTALTQGYLGGLNADSIQATAQVGYGDSCADAEIGTMAQQQSYPDTTALYKMYNLNQSLLVCQKSLLCANSADFKGTDTSQIKSCWLPLSTITVDINFNVNDKVLAFEAPSGFYIKPGSVVYQKRADNLNNVGTGGKRYGGFGAGNNGGDVSNTLGNMHCEGTHEVMGGLIRYTSRGYFSLPNGSYQSNGVYAPATLLNQATKTTNKGLTVWQDNDNIVSFDAGGGKGYGNGKYFTASGFTNCNSFATQNNTQYENWKLRASDFIYKFGITFPYQASSKWDIMQAVYDASTGDAGNYCAAWHNAQIVSIPYYITKLTLTNDTDNVALDSSNPPAPAPQPIPPSGTCSASNIPAYMKQEATDAMNNYKYDVDTYQQVVVASANNFNIKSSNNTPNSCDVQATANYCPAQSTTGCKYDVNIAMSNGKYLKWGSPCMGPNWKAMSAVADGTKRVDEYCGNPQRHCSYIANSGQLNQWVPLSCNDGGMGNYMTTITAGSCAPANQCTNPITKVIYQNGYSF